MSHAEEYTALLCSGHTVETYVDADACDGLPEHLHGLTRLDIGLNTRIPVAPLEVTNDGIRAGLTFSGRVCVVLIPWSAVACCKDVAGNEYLRNMVLVRALVKKQAEPAPQRKRKRKRPAPSHPRREGNVIRVDFAARRRVS